MKNFNYFIKRAFDNNEKETYSIISPRNFICTKEAHEIKKLTNFNIKDL